MAELDAPFQDQFPLGVTLFSNLTQCWITIFPESAHSFANASVDQHLSARVLTQELLQCNPMYCVQYLYDWQRVYAKSGTIYVHGTCIS